MRSKNKNLGELINHLGLVRARVQGEGNLKVTAISLGNNDFQELVAIPLESSTDKIPTVLANFKKQKMQIEVRTTEMDEFFRMKNIVPFTKPTAASYPM